MTYSACLQCGQVNRVNLSSARDKKPVCGKCKSELPIEGGVSELSGSGLTALVQKSPLPVIVDFWAPWCGPCQAFAPTFKKAAEALVGQVVFAKVNTQAHPFAGDAFQIRGIPTLIVFQGGLERERISGALPYDQLLRWIQAAVQSRKAA